MLISTVDVVNCRASKLILSVRMEGTRFHITRLVINPERHVGPAMWAPSDY